MLLLDSDNPTATPDRTWQVRPATRTSCFEIDSVERPGLQLPLGRERGGIQAESQAGPEFTPASVREARSEVSEVSDEVLVEQCRSELPHHLAAYEELVRRHEPLVFNTCAKMIGSRTDAEEVCQDAFLQVYHKLHQFEGRSTFKTWLFRIVYNMCLNRRGSIARRNEKNAQLAQEVDVQVSANLADAGTGDLSDTVQRALGRLDEEKRRIVMLKFVSGLSLQETADTLGLKLSATKMRLYRALDEFKVAYLEIASSEAA